MDEIGIFAGMVLVVAVGFALALFGRSVIERLAIPSAALFLAAAAGASDVSPRLGDAISFVTVERIGVVALIVILLDGGMDIGWRRFRAAAAATRKSAALGIAKRSVIARPKRASVNPAATTSTIWPKSAISCTGGL